MTTRATAIHTAPAPQATIRDLLSDGKGILAADESTGTIEKRLRSVGVDSTATSRRAYREMLFTAPGLEEHVGGVILYDETLRQTSSTGQPMVDLLREHGLVPGIKVDRGTKPLAGFPGEMITEGLDGLRERLAEYAAFGAAFTKWRAVFSVSRERPSLTSIASNADALARFAALTQEAGLVPIVEPEVLAEGDHPLERTEEVTAAVLAVVFHELRAHRVVLEHMLLKPNMVLPGRDHRPPPSREAVAEGDAALPPSHGAGRGAGHRLPLGRPERDRGHRTPRRPQLRRPRAVGAQLFLRPRAAGLRIGRLARRRRQSAARAGGVAEPRPGEPRRAALVTPVSSATSPWAAPPTARCHPAAATATLQPHSRP
ncbi:MAG TPA: class I fructose-bisphosphate aldolase, partial [Opitutaceae bacterium]|nr:class I fructose-bisphosphate aldolase [Opitutaceae bacterium]